MNRICWYWKFGGRTKNKSTFCEYVELPSVRWKEKEINLNLKHQNPKKKLLLRITELGKQQRLKYGSAGMNDGVADREFSMERERERKRWVEEYVREVEGFERPDLDTRVDIWKEVFNNWSLLLINYLVIHSGAYHFRYIAVHDVCCRLILIIDITLLLQHFDSYTIKHVYKEANRTVDWIANVEHVVSLYIYVPHSQTPLSYRKWQFLRSNLERRTSAFHRKWRFISYHFF